MLLLRELIGLSSFLFCYGRLLDPNNLHPTQESQLLLDLKNILKIEKDDIPEYNAPPSAIITIIDSSPPVLLNRTKRIPHDTYSNEIYDNQQIYVSDSGEDLSKLHSSGPWGEWSGVSECSRSCGGGVAQSTRVCEDEDESVCEGVKVRYFSCNTHGCGGGMADFRTEQCGAYSDVPFEGRFYTWVPYTRAPNKCELNCMPQGERFYYRHKRKTIDGTSCGVDLICVNGNCLPVGCDGILGSRKRQDKCRVCGGDGSSCNTVQGVFDSNDLQVGYNDVLLIPAGATNIVVRETQATNNYLAIRNTSGHYYLNGNWRIDFPREIVMASTTFHYERKPHTFFAPETIRALGPISEAIYVVVLYQEANPGITFEYSVPRGVVIETEPGTEYAWIYEEWGECSRECGGGTQNRNVNCARRSSSTLNWDYVETHLCDAAVKPETFRYCNYEVACPVRWHISQWDECTAPCGSDITGSQIRNVFCEQEIQGVSAVVESEKCVEAHGAAPERMRNCSSTKTDECTSWFVGGWKGCSSLCGDGYDTRVVRCVSRDELGRVVIHGDGKCVGGKPAEYEYCFSMPCEGVDWIVEGEWGECKVPSTPTCSSPESASLGTQSREVYCSDSKGKVYDEKYCHAYRRPNTTQPCELDFNPAEDPSCKYTWYATQWSDCEFQSCSEMGKGKKSRKVFCGTVMGEDGGVKLVGEGECDEGKRYHGEEECAVGDEVVEKECGDEEARLRKGRWFGGPWGECSKPCGGGRRNRAVLCMVGNRSTTDVKICGEEDVIFTTEDCNAVSCDDLTPEELETATDDSLLITDEPDDVDDVESSTATEEPCEPIDDDYYPDEYEDEVPAAGMVSMVTGRSTRSVDDESGTTEMMSDLGSTVGGVTMETGSGDGEVTGGSSTESGVSGDDLGEGSSSHGSSTEGMDDVEGSGVSMVTGESGGSSTGSSSSDDGVTVSMGGISTDDESGVTMTTTVGGSSTMSMSTSEGGSTIGGSTTTGGGGSSSVVMMSSTTAAGVTMTTGGGGSTEETTMGMETSSTTTEDAVSTTTDSMTTTTDSMTTASDSMTTTDSMTTASDSMTTASDSVTTTTTDAMTTSTMDVTTTGAGTNTSPPESSTMTTGGGSSSSSPSSSSGSMGSTTSPGVTMTTTMGGSTDDGSTTVMSTSEFGRTTADEGMTTTEDYDLGKDIPPLRMAGESDSTLLPTGETDDGSVTTDDSTGVMDDEIEAVTEVDYVTDYVTELGFTTMGTVTLPRCKPKARKAKVPSFCHKSKFGCCPGNEKNATGPFHEGCVIVKSCEETEFGCCEDGVRVAMDKRRRNCVVDCKGSLFGCCTDGKGVALGNNMEGCVKDCSETEFGCCLDGKTAKKGPKGRNCPKIPCSQAIYGCCPDDKTPAEGPNYKDCKEINLENCKVSFFGCCIDGTTTALGENEEGCPDTPPCVRTEHGCCPDGVTSAHGANNEGCCASSRFGCCTDNINEAKGFEFEGCDCNTSPYGCCPDLVTPARGEDKDCGCKFSEHGCCPDGVSTASGGGNEGCGCSTYQFGCCPDGVTVAKGVDKQGCGCAYTEFGCCPDGRTPKNSSDGELCGCESSVFGCCPDGVSNALGDEFEGCEDVPIKPGDVCGLDKERGSCRNFTVRWFFDMEYGGCSRFWWGGCEGNLNKFSSQDECRSVCVEPEGRDACYLPKVGGPCEGYYPSWYYDPLRESCEQFIYSGCLGNNNRFGSRGECENRCLVPERVDDCDQPRTEGPCRGNYSRYYYDKTSEKCELFTYGGCKGNSNNFLTEKECHQRCGKDVRMRDVCFQPRSEGPCNEKLPRWYYDGGEQRCVPFYYSGCQGNSNRFSNLDECEKTCPAALLGEVGGCLEGVAPGDCASYTERYYFDRYEGKCKTFIYSGCGGNTNNFVSIDDCRTKCETFVPKPVASSEDQQFSEAHCFLPPPDDPTSCQNSPNPNQPPTVRWYYDNHDGVCYQFRYYCSNSSLNNFDTRQDCEDKCGASQDFCGLPVVSGPCSGRFLQYYYDKEGDSCQAFEYSGCSGNGNRFDTVVQCEQRCKKGGYGGEDNEVVDVGGEVEEDEESRRYREELEERRRQQEEERRRIEDERRRVDEERRRNQEEADEEERRRGREESGSVSQEDICVLDVDQGPCRAAVEAFYFDRRVGKCGPFLYGGCGGNANRFESEEMCERQCGQFRGQDVCNQTPDPGPCTSDSQKTQKWYFNTVDQACAMFLYSGCDGNGNRFSSRDECESVCYSRSEIVSGNDTITGAAICRLQPDTGPCVDGFKRWYYNHEEKTCIPFVFGGCAGNLNRFKSFETCVGFCEKALGYTYREEGGGGSGVVVRSGDHGVDGGHGGDAGDGGKSGGGDAGGGGRNSNNYYYSDDINASGSNNPSPPDNSNQYSSAPCDCSYIKCPYGISPQNTSYSCTCECYDPCSSTYCPDPSSRCAVDIQGGSFIPVCRSMRKSGSCPPSMHPQQQQHHHRHHHGDRICDNECSSDADCSGDLKCCVLGCGSSCVVAIQQQQQQGGGGEREGGEISIVARVGQLNVSEGGLVEMECDGRGSPRPDVIWMRVDSNEKITGESGRFRITEHSHTHNSITSKLQIIGPTTQDAGDYTCIASTPSSSPTSDLITVHIHESPTSNAASVLEDPTVPTTQIVNLGQTANLRCFALGWPRPSVTWWRGERMLPFSSERYEQMRDYSLVIRLVSLRDLGVYTCQAYNGLGRAASWSISLLAYGPVQVVDGDDREYLVYVVDTGSGQVMRNFSSHSTSTSTTTSTTTTTTTEKVVDDNDVVVGSYYVPLRASITLERTHYNAGSEIRIPCDVEGHPAPGAVSWYKDNVLLDLGVGGGDGGDDDGRVAVRYDPPQSPTHHPSTLTIQRSTQSDSASYRCEAQNDYTTASSPHIQITVAEETNLHVNCTDNSFFANCKLIVKANYCTNKYYARFCCKSCTLAGQLPPYGPHLQEVGQAYFRRGGGSGGSGGGGGGGAYSSQLLRRSISSDGEHSISNNDLFN